MFCIYGKYLYENPLRSMRCFQSVEIQEALRSMQQDKRGFWVGYVCYEALQIAESKTPLLEFILFKTRRKWNFYAMDSTFSLQSPYFYPHILQDCNPQGYAKAFASIKEEIAKGNTYQVNFTQELHLKSHCSGFEIFKALNLRQKTKYRCYFKSDAIEILSFSPELFFKIRNQKIIFQPMKGTMRRGNTKKEDENFKKLLQKDSKNQSENLMIVDLLRNDMSQIIKLSTLKIPRLLKILKFKTLFQMVSTLKAQLNTKDLFAIFTAVFPCGSITGAPKASTMRIIKQLEKRDRGVYCGALGVLKKAKATFSVPIRTLTYKANEGFYRYGVGSGIVWESDGLEEFRELQLKTQFLFPPLEFALFETMLLYENKVFLLHKHKERLLKSAKMLGFNRQKLGFLQNIQAEQALTSLCLEDFFTLSYAEPLKWAWGEFLECEKFGIRVLKEYSKLHLVLHKNGEFSFTQSPLDSIKTHQVGIAALRLNAQNDLLYHKTTLREERSIAKNYFDMLYFNQSGELCEGARSNIAVLKDGMLLTPFVSCGLLGGTLREVLLECGILKETVLKKEDLLAAKNVYCMNALRGVLPVQLAREA